MLALPPHRNPGLEVVLILAGRLEWQVEGKVHPLGPGDVFFTLPWQTHGSVHPREPGHEWIYVILAATGRAPGTFQLPFLDPAGAGERRLLGRLARAEHQSLRTSPLLRELLFSLHGSRSDGNKGDPGRCAALARALIFELVRQWDHSPPPRPPEASPLHRLVTEMSEHLDHPWSLAEMARRCRLGRTRFEVLFRREFGDPPVTHLNRLRVQAGARLLEGTRNSITEIAHTCGFSSSQYFARVFRRFMGTNPEKWRREHPDRAPVAHHR